MSIVKDRLEHNRSIDLKKCTHLSTIRLYDWVESDGTRLKNTEQDRTRLEVMEQDGTRLKKFQTLTLYFTHVKMPLKVQRISMLLLYMFLFFSSGCKCKIPFN